jgi:hypothetical protein
MYAYRREISALSDHAVMRPPRPCFPCCASREHLIKQAMYGFPKSKRIGAASGREESALN